MKKTKKTSFLIVFLFLAIGNLFAQNNGDQIIGKWISEDNNRTVEVYKTNGKYSAKIIAAKSKQEIGKLIIWGLQYNESEKEWSDGQVQLPDMSHSAACYVKLKGSKVIITGYHGLRIFGSSQTYNRKK